jgi:hypothetical protein
MRAPRLGALKGANMSTPKSESEMYEQDAKEALNLRQDAERRGDTQAAEYLRDRQSRSEKAASLKGGSSKSGKK